MAEKSAWIYVRVSSEEQTKGYSLESQEMRCRDYAAQQGYTVIGVAKDVESGEQLDRQGLMQVIETATTNPFDVLIVYDLDRFSRGGPAHCAILETQFERKGVTVEFVLGNFNGDSAEATLAKYLKQSISWYENQQRRERTMRGRITAAKHGKVLTGARPPYGYIYTQGRLSIEPEEADIVRRIFQELLEGVSARKIAEHLSAERVSTAADKKAHIKKRNDPGIWHFSTVLKIIRNPVYIGVWRYNKRRSVRRDGKSMFVPRPSDEWIEVAVPPLIDLETFNRAQAQLDKNRVQAKRNTRTNYLLQHLIVCACGHRCASELNNQSGVRLYTCPNRRRRAWEVTCPVNVMLKADTLEAMVWRLVVDLLLNPTNLKAWFAMQRAQAADARRTLMERLDAINVSLQDVKKKHGALLDLALTSGFPRSVVEDRRKLLTAQQQRLEQERRQAQAALASIELSNEHEQGLLTMAERLRAGIEHLDFAAQRKVLELLQVQVNVVERRKVRVQALLPIGGHRLTAPYEPGDHVTGLAVEIDLTTGDVRTLHDTGAFLLLVDEEQEGGA